MRDPALVAQLEEVVADALEADLSWSRPVPDTQEIARLAVRAIRDRLEGLGETLGGET